MTKKLLPIFLSFVLSGLSAQKSEKSIEELVITGKNWNGLFKNVNENLVVVSKEEIKNSPATNVADLLQFYSGLDIRRRGANGVQSDIAVRGSSFEQVLILINGVRLNDSQTGHNSFNLPVDISAIERIEIIKGASAKLYGQNAFAGVVNIVTKTSSSETVSINANYGDFETYDLGLTATFGTERFSNLLSVNSASSSGYRFNTDYKTQNYFYQNKLNIKNGFLGLLAGFSEKKFGANGFYSTPSAINQYEETQASVVALQYEQRFERLNLKSNLYWRRGQDMYLFDRWKPSVYRNMHIGNNIGLDANANYNWSLGKTGLGVDYRKEYLSSNNLGKRERDVFQMFLDHEFSLLEDKLEINPSVSWANYSGDNFVYPGLELGYNVGHHKWFANVSKVYRVPTFTDLYYLSKTEEGNPNLIPETAISSELGYKYVDKQFLIKLSAFMRNTENGIDWLKPNEAAVWKAENVGAIKMKGFEAEFEQRLFEFLKYNVNYTYLDNRYKNTELSRYALENLKHQLIGKVDIKFLKNFSSQWIYRYIDRVNLGSYNLLDAQLSYHKNAFGINISVNNITNSRYVETNLVPMPGRWYNLGLTYQIKIN